MHRQKERAPQITVQPAKLGDTQHATLVPESKQQAYMKHTTTGLLMTNRSVSHSFMADKRYQLLAEVTGHISVKEESNGN